MTVHPSKGTAGFERLLSPFPFAPRLLMSASPRMAAPVHRKCSRNLERRSYRFIPHSALRLFAKPCLPPVASVAFRSAQPLPRPGLQALDGKDVLTGEKKMRKRKTLLPCPRHTHTHTRKEGGERETKTERKRERENTLNSNSIANYP